MPDITQPEFAQRFIDRMVDVVGLTFANGTDVREYAKTSSSTYWNQLDMRKAGPEDCADFEIEYGEWEDA